MRSRFSWSACALLAIPSLAGAIELRNDDFGPSSPGAVFQSGFAAGDVAASRFLAPCAAARVLAARVLFGGAAGTRTVNLRIYDDSNNTISVGMPVFANNFQVISNNSVLTEIPLATFNIVMPPRLRIGVAFTQAGLPSIARDGDGSINPGVNFIQAEFGGPPPVWVTSQSQGVTGDWIIRAEVECVEDIFQDSFEDPPPP